SSERRFRLLFERNLAGVVRMNLDGTILECNEAFAGIVGATAAADLTGRSLSEMIEDADSRGLFCQALQRDRFVSNTEARIVRPDGAGAWLLLNLGSPSADDSPFVEGTVLDITERKDAEAKIAHQAHHDPLTGLCNRAYFIDQLEQSMALARRQGTSLGLLYIDLDEFKPINDTLGHAAGDALLQEVASRLSRGLRRTDVVGRMGGDEFILLLNSLKHDDDAAIVAAKTLETLAEPVEHAGRTLRITASIGAAIFPRDADETDSFIAAADRAMYTAKNAGKNRYSVSPGRAATEA
ncbi:MAG: sensor domain-containing diguanylate cyclase, partial [Thermoanaerobaculia bacterium]|nr:sensor domain-containing diguanylate cyclase [Thermoanaerobaculia bacterium]